MSSKKYDYTTEKERNRLYEEHRKAKNAELKEPLRKRGVCLWCGAEFQYDKPKPLRGKTSVREFYQIFCSSECEGKHRVYFENQARELNAKGRKTLKRMCPRCGLRPKSSSTMWCPRCKTLDGVFSRFELKESEHE